MKNLRSNFNHLAGVLAASWLMAGAGSTLAQFTSPVGTWDCVVSGRERGVAYLTFAADNTFSGYEVLTPKQVGVQTDDNLRGPDNIGRTFEASTGPTTTTNFSGFLLLSGYWSHDITGKKILGFYTEGNFTLSCSTNQVITSVTTSNQVTNPDGSITISNSVQWFTNDANIVCVTNGLTNNLSFTAIVNPGSRLSLKATSANGNKNLKGVPATPIADLSGGYYAEGKKSGLKFIEFLSFEASSEYPNAFDVYGGGGGYELEGIAVASRQKKMGFIYRGSGENDPLVSVFGSINYSTLKSNLKGVDSNEAKITYKITPLFSLD